MAKRITIMIDDENFKKIIGIQAKKIQTSQSSYSFSKAINDVLRKGLK